MAIAATEGDAPVQSWAGYFTILPLALLVASVALFLTAATIIGSWGNGGLALLRVGLLSLETFFLPYLMAPIAIVVPALLPWTDYKPGEILSLKGGPRFRQPLIISMLMIMPGLPVLAYHDAQVGDLGLLTLPTVLGLAATWPALLFGFLILVMAIPDFAKGYD